MLLRAVHTAVPAAVRLLILMRGLMAGAVDCDSRRAVGPIRTIRGVYMTQLNRLQRLAALSTPNEWSFYV